MLGLMTRHAPQAEGRDHESHGDQPARIEFGRKRAGHRKEKHEHQSAGGDGHARLSCRVAHDLLQKLRDQNGGRIERDADHEHHQLGHADVAACEQTQIEDGMLDGKFTPEEQDAARSRR